MKTHVFRLKPRQDLLITIVELVIGELESVTFTRRPDPATGYGELEVKE